MESGQNKGVFEGGVLAKLEAERGRLLVRSALRIQSSLRIMAFKKYFEKIVEPLS